jgi:hypothetical protein
MTSYPLRQKSAHGQPRPLTSITRSCKTCGASFIGLAPGKTGERGLWDHGSRWYCSTECAPAAVREAAHLEAAAERAGETAFAALMHERAEEIAAQVNASVQLPEGMRFEWK